MQLCTKCGGFRRSSVCPHCGEKAKSAVSPLVKALGGALGGGAIAFTLMACYGAPPCPDSNKDCYGPPPTPTATGDGGPDMPTAK